MRKKWTMEQILRGQNQRAKQAGARHDLTMKQWLETLEYFDHKCAYCGGEHEVIELYLPFYKAGTTVSNCVPACLHHPETLDDCAEFCADQPNPKH